MCVKVFDGIFFSFADFIEIFFVIFSKDFGAFSNKKKSFAIEKFSFFAVEKMKLKIIKNVIKIFSKLIKTKNLRFSIIKQGRCVHMRWGRICPSNPNV